MPIQLTRLFPTESISKLAHNNICLFEDKKNARDAERCVIARTKN